MKQIYKESIFSSLSLIFLCTLLFWIIPSSFAAYGVSDADKPAMKAIQEQLTNNYLDTNKKAIGLRILEEKILESKIDVLTIEDNIAEYDSDIALLQEKINILLPQISDPKRRIAEIKSKKQELKKGIKENGEKLVIIYLELNSFKKFNNSKTSGAEGLLAILSQNDEEKISEKISIESLEKVEKHVREIYRALATEYKSIDDEEKQISEGIDEKQKKYLSLSEKRDKLQQEKEFQETLLLQASSEKEEYSELLTMSRKQMMQSMIDAVKTDSKLQELNEKIKKLEEEKIKELRAKAKNNAEKIKNIELKDEYSADELDEATIASIDLKTLEDAENTPIRPPLSWPINPVKGISAGFRDSGYYKQFKMQHNAIDIRAPQGTQIRSAGDGYVYKAVDNGLGYSYIIILHRNNLRTLYGHVSSIYVKSGQMIEEGQIIGLSGGMPGTKGAGKMTTGPHLHFETLENEVYKNPLNYLDNGVL